MFDPTGLGIDLGVFLLTDTNDVLIVVKKNGTGTGGALVEGDDILFHGAASCMYIFVV